MVRRMLNALIITVVVILALLLAGFIALVVFFVELSHASPQTCFGRPEYGSRDDRR